MREADTERQGVIPLMGNVQDRPIHRQAVGLGVFRGWGGGEWLAVTQCGGGISFCSDGMFWN